ncbi:MAG: hypothetical protein ISN26_02385 [Betaproteobacteria bacterium AqS2]|uniref:Uncharacterized protein n=1 Tax=Candidatus Amphirhobacter heronislandensis TaxID=1732024 RepID=A0A930UHE3_9GAMM|nr:hypothetical protein [Betaproteobacteria bacterium AqS2]
MITIDFWTLIFTLAVGILVMGVFTNVETNDRWKELLKTLPKWALFAASLAERLFEGKKSEGHTPPEEDLVKQERMLEYIQKHNKESISALTERAQNEMARQMAALFPYQNRVQYYFYESHYDKVMLTLDPIPFPDEDRKKEWSKKHAGEFWKVQHFPTAIHLTLPLVRREGKLDLPHNPQNES